MSKRKSYIVQQFGADAERIRRAIAEANQRVKELERENEQLRRQIKKLNISNKKSRQRLRSQTGALKAQRAKVQKLRIALKKARSVNRRSIGIRSVTHRTRAQYLEQAKPMFISRFIDRLHSTYPDFKPEWDATVRTALNSLSYDEIDGIMRMLNLDSMYYESNGYRPNAGATGTMIYEYFVQFIPQPGA